MNTLNDAVFGEEHSFYKEVFGEGGLADFVSSVQSDVSDLSDTVSGVQSDVSNLSTNVANKRVQIYTTWGGNGTAEVAFINATPQQQGGVGKSEQP